MNNIAQNEVIEILMDIQSDWEDGVEYEAFNVALTAVEKQIPRKPLKEFNGIQILKMCLCGGEAYSYPSSFNYCPYCGQKIDWEELK